VQQISCYRLNQIKVAMMNLVSWCLHQTAAPPPALITGVYPDFSETFRGIAGVGRLGEMEILTRRCTLDLSSRCGYLSSTKKYLVNIYVYKSGN
jgi:hypothetical protein